MAAVPGILFKIISSFFIKNKEKSEGKDFSPNIISSIHESNIGKIEDFFGVSLPEHIKGQYKDKQIYKELNKQEIMKIIAFRPPFLRIDKMVVFNNNEDILQSKGLGMGVITLKDTAGHYNDTIFLAMCGWLMASSASIHLAVFYSQRYDPQVIKASGVRPLLSVENSGIWKPSNENTVFFVESNILKKKMGIILMETNITFGKIIYGTIEELTMFLARKGLIWAAKEIPNVNQKKVNHGF